jgi:peptide/nickel transport system substrate-binding protein
MTMVTVYVRTAIAALAAACMTAAIAAEPAHGGNLSFVHLQRLDSLDPNINSATNAAHIMGQIYDPLVWQPEPGVFEPGLAERWEVSPDGLTYTFWLRQDVVFHDGEPFTAHDVTAMFDRILDPANRSLQAPRLEFFEGAEALDDHTVRMTFNEPDNAFISNLSEVAFSPPSRASVERLGDAFTMAPVAAGPFRFQRWVDDNTLVLERNPDYHWGPDFMANQGSPYLDTVTYRIVEEPATRVIALESGEAHIINGPAEADIQRLSANPSFGFDSIVGPGMPQVLQMNVERPPFDDILVRRAVLHAVDVETLVDVIFFGAHPVGTGPFTSSLWGYWDGVEEAGYEYDLERAEQLLDEAGWIMNSATGIREKDGATLTVRHVTPTSTHHRRISEYVQASLQEIGFDYQVEAMAQAATGVRFAAGDYEMGRGSLSGTDPSRIAFMIFHSTQILEGAQYNRSRIADDVLDDLITRAAVETDPDARLELYKEFQERVLELAVIIPIYESTVTHIYRADEVNGLHVNVLGRPYLQDVWLTNP